jgi:hypothetical protein
MEKMAMDLFYLHPEYRVKLQIPATSCIVTEDLVPNLPFQPNKYKKTRIIAKSDYV